MTTEQVAFGERLKKLLAEKGFGTGPTRLAREFNACSAKQISVHAARKWIEGESIPTQGNLRTLSAMFGVELNWLRFGDGEQDAAESVCREEMVLKLIFRDLDSGQRSVLLATAYALKAQRSALVKPIAQAA